MAAGGDVVTFGEMLLRLSPPAYETFLESAAFTANFGGCEANVAVALARLGVSASYVTVLPENAIGDAALNTLRAALVDTRNVVRTNGRMGLYFVELGAGQRATRVVYDRERSAFALEPFTRFDWPAILGSARWFHGSGITPALSADAASALANAIHAARSAHVTVSVDLNYRPALWENARAESVIAPLVRGVDMLIGNARAVRKMLSVHAPDDATSTPAGALALARELARQFEVRTIVLTRREMPSEDRHLWSAHLYDTGTDTIATSRTYDVRVVDRVGGGDAFAGALIASLIRGDPAATAVEYAAAAGALKLAVPGDFATFTDDEITRAVAAWK